MTLFLFVLLKGSICGHILWHLQCHNKDRDRIKTSSKLAEFESSMSETSKRSADFKDVYMGLRPPNKPRDLADTYLRYFLHQFPSGLIFLNYFMSKIVKTMGLWGQA